MFSFFKKKPAKADVPAAATPSALADSTVQPEPVEGRPGFDKLNPNGLPVATNKPTGGSLIGKTLAAAIEIPVPSATPERQSWVEKLKKGLGKTTNSFTSVFGGSLVDEALYEKLEDALLMADAGVTATETLIANLRRKAQTSGITHPVALKNALIAALTEMLQPLEKSLTIGQQAPTVLMVVGVNGAGKTTSIGKLTSSSAS